MKLHSLKSKIILGVSLLVLGSGIMISLLATRHYSNNLFKAIREQAKDIARSVALEATDKILVNDLVGLQKMLEHQIHSNPSLSYLFILKDKTILAHTFDSGVPIGLITANYLSQGTRPRIKEIVSTGGEHYLDVAWPIFKGKAGLLRLGFSEEPFRKQVRMLWFKVTAITFVILLLGIIASALFVKRITGPLADLVRASNLVRQGDLSVRVSVNGKGELAELGQSFNHMITRLEDYTRKLKRQASELERAHHQTRSFCEIIQEIASLNTLDEIARFLIQRLQRILNEAEIVLLIISESEDSLTVLTKDGCKYVADSKAVYALNAVSNTLENEVALVIKSNLHLEPYLPESFKNLDNRILVPFDHAGQLFGAVFIACESTRQCSHDELELISTMLFQGARVIRRAVLHEEALKRVQRRSDFSSEYCGIVGKDPKMQAIFRLIEDIANTDATVLIEGESGTGKELVARAIHAQSFRRDNPFIVINCAAYPDTLLESELFGHEKGAFTGAVRTKPGRFEQGDGGTVFLDEIAEIPLSAQVKLLRVLQTKSFERLGGEKTITVDVRVIAATNKDIMSEVKKGRFREDLYYRINVIPVKVPPLRERRNDIPLLARYFLKRFSREQNKKIDSISPSAMRVFLDYQWPGNVRELENTMEHAVSLAKTTTIEVMDIPAAICAKGESRFSKTCTMKDHERQLLETVLKECGWNKKETARRLGISRSTLYNKLKKYDIPLTPST